MGLKSNPHGTSEKDKDVSLRCVAWRVGVPPYVLSQVGMFETDQS